MGRPKKPEEESFKPITVTLSPRSLERVEKMMAADDETNRSRWFNDAIDTEWSRRYPPRGFGKPSRR